jgi:two-component system CheB/CheR fusion protein
MILFEIQDSKNIIIPFQIFASDLSSDAINEARNGEYTLSQLKNVSPKRIQRFFTKLQDKYRITKSLRDVCIFAPHNILRDPPFSRMDFISCRNLLIYLDTPAQKKTIATFHYALNENGCLMLGKSETIGSSIQLFSTPLNKKIKIYTRKKDSGSRSISDITPRLLQSSLSKSSNASMVAPKKITATLQGNLSSAFDSYLLTQHVPASVVINHDLEILQFRGSTSLYLQNSTGKASFNILKMANIEITFELRNAIHHAIKTKQTVRKSGIEINRDKSGNVIRMVDLEVSPLKIDGDDNLLIIVFTGQMLPETDKQIVNDANNNSFAKDRRIKKLEEEIAAARYDMASITQDQEAANEELQSANEEIVSSNEELQSLNEELETSKEEIESTNEELIITNQELQIRVQQVEELYNYYETILSTVHEPMLILDRNLRIISTNKSFCKFFHISEDECTKVLLYKLGNGEWNIPRLRELLEEIVPKNNHFHGYEVELSFAIIGIKTMILNAHRIIQISNGEELIVLTMTDITDVRKLAIELQVKEKKILEVQLDIEKKALKESEDSNDELKEANTTALLKTQIAEDAVKAKQQFLSNMSHEIRTPMNAIIGFTNVILKTNLDETQKEYLNAIKVSGDALIILINDILDLAKVNAGKMTFERSSFDLALSITSIIHLFESKINEKNIELHSHYDINIPPMVIGDAMRLRQILLNLVSNAVKFTIEGSITINVRLIDESDDKVTIEFTIVDTGIGIPNNRLEYIFNSFEQADKDTSRSYGGTGLGLAIVKQLVELQGGTIIIQSEVDKGSTFGFVLQFEKLTSSTLLATSKKQVNTSLETFIRKTIKNVKVLVAEDLALNQLLIKIILLDLGFEIDIADNGKGAIDLLKKKQYDIILMDLQMPIMNGFEATAYIRHEMNNKTPIIALTADVTTVDIGKCLSVGMNDYISKPIDEEILYHKIVKYLKK